VVALSRVDVGPATQAAFDDAYETVLWPRARRDRLDEKITALAADSEFTAVTRRLSCLRGISTLTGFALAVEIGGWDRFTGASIGGYLGLVPSDTPLGRADRRGRSPRPAICTHVRRLLVEAVWHHRNPYRPGIVLQWASAPNR